MDGYRLLADWEYGDGQRIDQAMIEGQMCKCGGIQHFEAWRSPSGSYVALAVCGKCHRETEI